ncbi:hypothetical protein [Saccharopolyspora sp. ID03-671]|uniref:hypothetical protein n=1 Tax=Saccharopolyspora sp. ID03-671 TaxID=3073066 RepID=UPI0038737CE2
MSAPIRDFRGRVTAALNISAPTSRLPDLDRAGRATAAAATAISIQLGYPEPPN